MGGRKAGGQPEKKRRLMLLESMDQFGSRGQERGEGNNAFLEELLRAVRYATECELTPRQRACFELYYEQGLAAREIAKRLGLCDSTVSRHIAAARKKVRRYARYCAFGSAPGGKAGESHFME